MLPRFERIDPLSFSALKIFGVTSHEELNVLSKIRLFYIFKERPYIFDLLDFNDHASLVGRKGVDGEVRFSSGISLSD